MGIAWITDAANLPPRRWGDNKLHEKVNNVWYVISEKREKVTKKETPEAYKLAWSVPKEKKDRLRKQLNKNLENNVKNGYVDNSTIGETKISSHSVSKLGSDKALDKSMVNGFLPEEHFDAASRVVELYKNAELKAVDADINGDPNIYSIKRFSQEFITCKGKKATAWITVKESKQNGHRLYSIEVMEIKKADN